jgi:hypothetical protein
MSHLHPQEILRRVLDAYASAAYYADRGVAELSAGGIRGEFHTEFARSQGLFFSWRVTSGAGLIGKECRFRTDRHNIVSAHGVNPAPTSIADTIVRMSGITFGAAHMIPRMLLPNDIPGRMLCASENARLAHREEVAGIQCMVLEVNDTDRVTIGEDDFLIRRILFRRRVSEDVVAAARSRNIDATVVPPWTTTLTYEAKALSSEPAGYRLDAFES